MTHSSFNSFQLFVYSALLRVRPAELGQCIKSILHIERKFIPTSLNAVFWADPVSVFGQALLKDGIYESQMSHLVMSLLRENDVFVDIGGNEAYFSVLASRVIKNGRVFCVEPQSRLIPVIEKNLELNRCKNVSVSRVALSAQEGTTELYLRPNTNTGSSSLFQVSKMSTVKETVPTQTLEKYCLENGIDEIRLMKIDCEGAEALVIEGGKEIFKQKKVQILALEYHPQVLSEHQISEINLFLKDCGYRFCQINDQTVYCLPQYESQIKLLG